MNTEMLRCDMCGHIDGRHLLGCPRDDRPRSLCYACGRDVLHGSHIDFATRPPRLPDDHPSFRLIGGECIRRDGIDAIGVAHCGCCRAPVTRFPGDADDMMCATCSAGGCALCDDDNDYFE